MVTPPTLLLHSRGPMLHCDTRFDITLAHMDHCTPVFTDLSNEKIQEKVTSALDTNQCQSDSGPCASSVSCSDREENCNVRINAVGCHHSGNIWISTCSENELKQLLKMEPQ